MSNNIDPDDLSPVVQQYTLDELTQFFTAIQSVGLSGVTNEPLRLRHEANTINEEITKLALGNYMTYLDHASASEELSNTVSKLSSTLESMVGDIPLIRANISRISQGEGKDLLRDFLRNRATLRHHSSLLELLEVPQLMDTCVRNELYDEALSLLGFSTTLERRHSSDGSNTTSIIGGIVSDIRNHGNVMRDQLFNTLKTDIELPLCLKTISYLRRFDSHLRASKVDYPASSESEKILRSKFLECRSEWTASVIKQIPSNDPFNYIYKLVDKCRVMWYSIITQYQAIFDGDNDTEIEGSLHTWLVDAVGTLLDAFRNNIGAVKDGGNISRLLDQCTYLGSYLSRVGCDIRSLLVPIFEQHITTMMRDSWKAAADEFHEELLNPDNSWASLFGGKRQSINSGITTAVLHSIIESNCLEPPEILMEVPIVAKYVNRILITFNELRLCALYRIKQELVAILLKSQESVSDSMATYNAMHFGGGGLSTADEPSTAAHRVRFHKACYCLVEIQLFYLAKSFDLLFTEDQSTTVTSFSAVKDKMMANGVYTSPSEDAVML